VRVHLGYLQTREYEAAQDYVLSKRKAQALPGVPGKPGATSAGGWVSGFVRKLFRRSSVQQARSTDELLLQKVLEETQKRKGRRGK
jgi:hypothetical protein